MAKRAHEQVPRNAAFDFQFPRGSVYGKAFCGVRCMERTLFRGWKGAAFT